MQTAWVNCTTRKEARRTEGPGNTVSISQKFCREAAAKRRAWSFSPSPTFPVQEKELNPPGSHP